MYLKLKGFNNIQEIGRAFKTEEFQADLTISPSFSPPPLRCNKNFFGPALVKQKAADGGFNQVFRLFGNF